jgi:hypothetical protein
MSEQPEKRNNGDRKSNGDAWLGRAVKIAALVGALSTIAFYGVPLAGIPARVAALEKSGEIQRDMLLMTCTLYQDAHPNTVPAVCDQALRRPIR